MTQCPACKEAYDELMVAYKTLKQHLKIAMDVERKLSLRCALLEKQRNSLIDSESYEPQTLKSEMDAELEKIA